jgi:hypothetical protein
VGVMVAYDLPSHHPTCDDYSLQQCALAWGKNLSFVRTDRAGHVLPRDPDGWYERAVRAGWTEHAPEREPVALVVPDELWQSVGGACPGYQALPPELAPRGSLHVLIRQGALPAR